MDNFFMIGMSQEDALQKYRRFLVRASAVGAELNEGSEFGSPESESRFVALGLDFDLESCPHGYRSEPAWVNKFVNSDYLGAVLANRAPLWI